MIRHAFILFSLALLWVLPLTASAAEVSLSGKGIVIDAGEAGKYTLPYPSLSADKAIKAGEAKVEGGVATLSYPNGAELRVRPGNEELVLQFTGLPDDVKGLRLSMTLPIRLKDGGTWSVDDSEPAPFPKEKESDAFFYRGDAKKLVIRDGDKGGFGIAIAHGYQQLQDNRHWNNTQNFSWIATAQLSRVNGNESYYQLRFSGPGGEPAKLPEAVAAASPAPASAAASSQTTGVTVALNDEGAAIKAGTAGTFLLRYPTIKGLEPNKPSNVTVQGGRATLEYAQGVTATVSLVDGRNVKVDLAGLPSSVQSARMDMRLPISFSQGGQYSIGGSAMQAFPAEKPDDPFLYRGSEDTLTVVHPTGPGFTLTLPSPRYQQLQDNREWNWTVFAWYFQHDLPSGGGNGTASFTVGIGDLPGGPAKSEPVVDRFGQWVKAEFPIKVRSEEELLRDAEIDREYYGSLEPPATDPYGGIPGTWEKYGLKKTGFFHLAKVNGADVFVTPDGNAFFQLGVCGLSPLDEYTTVKGRESIYEWLPSANDPVFKTAWRPNDPGVFSFHLANHIRKTGQPYEPYAYASMWIDRLRKWGFNSGGAWAYTGANEVATRAIHDKRYPYVKFVSLGKIPQTGIKGVWDVFAPGIEQTIDEAMGKQMAEDRDNPLIIGWFISNEPLIEDVPKIIPTLKASESPSKQRLIERLREKYGTVAKANAAWGTSAASFEEMGEQPLAITTRQAADDMQAFFAEFLERRYSLVNNAFRKHNPNHLLMGDRWMPGTANNELLVRTAGKYLDVVSVNYYTYGIDRNLMDRIHAWSGNKPMLLSEYFFSSPQESGLHGGRVLETQALRGQAYRHYVEQAAALGYVVGVQWFQQIDQATTGRWFQQFNGEAANTGLVNVADRPYKDFLAEVMKTNYDVMSVVTKEREPFELDDPRFTFKAGGAKKMVTVYRMVNTAALDGSRNEWPAVPPYRIEPKGSGDFEATFRVAWNDENLYLYIEVSDATPMLNTKDGPGIWDGDAVELFVGTDEPERAGTMMFSDRQVLIRGALAEGKEPAYYLNTQSQYPTRVFVAPQIDGKGYVIEAAIPFEALGFEPKVNQELLFDVAIDDGNGKGRVRQLVFNGTEQASKDRGVWGRAQLVP